MEGIIAKKIGMSRVFSGDGQVIPVTLLKIEMQKITKVLTPERDGYRAIQLGYFQKAKHRLTKADIARLKKCGVDETYTRFKEFRLDDAERPGFELGALFDLKVMNLPSTVDVTGVTKGRGFEGAIGRWGHKTGRRSHGSHFHRRPGSLGMRSTPGRVFKNKGMPGHMGDVNRTVQNLAVVKMDTENNILAVKGSVPGYKNGYVIVRPSINSK